MLFNKIYKILIQSIKIAIHIFLTYINLLFNVKHFKNHKLRNKNAIASLTKIIILSI